MGKLAEKIKAERLKLKIGVREFAERLGVSPGYLSRVEVRGEIPSPELICKIGDLLGIEPEELLDLAKEDVLARTKDDLGQRHSEVLRLYRRKK